MKKVEDLIQPALIAVRDMLALGADKKAVKKEYDGYVASFGAAVINSGLLPTLAFYSDYHKNSTSKGEPLRHHILKVFKTVLAQRVPEAATFQPDLIQFVFSKVYPGQAISNADQPLDNHAMDHQALRQLRQHLLDVSVAVKLALRNFEQIETKTPAP